MDSRLGVHTIGSLGLIMDVSSVDLESLLTLGLQIAQSRPYLYTLGPKVGIIYIHGAPGLVIL